MTLMPWRSVARCTLTATLSLQASSGFVTLLSSKTLSTSATASSTSSSHELSDLHGKASKWLLLSARREERIEALTAEGPLTEGEQAELAGLRDRSARFEEQVSYVVFGGYKNNIFISTVLCPIPVQRLDVQPRAREVQGLPQLNISCSCQVLLPPCAFFLLAAVSRECVLPRRPHCRHHACPQSWRG